ncbi:hypothetical protein L596_009669 [Steinernema carpocapsae]|uniref:Uncharacterized protein n=1 Tax=Steinernema carpocapsae TaxID=34508 RepID=A0A4U5PGI7_STECR|nr:hypothetical protein L596_009669 [Steinernema carpocapsae]
MIYAGKRERYPLFQKFSCWRTPTRSGHTGTQVSRTLKCNAQPLRGFPTFLIVGRSQPGKFMSRRGSDSPFELVRFGALIAVWPKGAVKSEDFHWVERTLGSEMRRRLKASLSRINTDPRRSGRS